MLASSAALASDNSLKIDTVSINAGLLKSYHSIDSKNGGVDNITSPDEHGFSLGVSATFENEIIKGLRPYIGFTKLDYEDRYFNIPEVGLRFDFNPRIDRFQPYVTAGLGYAFSKWDENPVNNLIVREPEGQSFDLVMQTGFDYYITKRLAVGAGIRLDTYDASSVIVQDSKVSTINERASLGALAILTYRFGSTDQLDQDSDGDGVSDYDDRCPNTLKNIPVNQYGCAMDMFTFSLEIKFDKFHIADLTESPNFPVVEFLKKHADYHVRITGHTDSTGNPNYNLRLSEKRANEAKDFLISKGVSEDRVISVGRGDQEPLLSNDSLSNRIKNRRISVIFYRSEKVLPK